VSFIFDPTHSFSYWPKAGQNHFAEISHYKAGKTKKEAASVRTARMYDIKFKSWPVDFTLKQQNVCW